MRYLSAAGVWAVTIWMDVTVMKLPDNAGEAFVAGGLTILSIVFTFCILFYGQTTQKRGG